MRLIAGTYLLLLAAATFLTYAGSRIALAALAYLILVGAALLVAAAFGHAAAWGDQQARRALAEEKSRRVGHTRRP